MFKRRLGSTLASRPNWCVGGYHCPDILEMESGDFAVIGADITEQARDRLLPGSGCGPRERVVQIPRQMLIAARKDIPATL